jgi:hypothetical protein
MMAAIPDPLWSSPTLLKYFVQFADNVSVIDELACRRRP